jgi:hypothetical protein
MWMVQFATSKQVFELRNWMYLHLLIIMISTTTLVQWEIQDPKMKLLHHIRPYVVGIFPQSAHMAHRPYIWYTTVGTSNALVPEMAIDMWFPTDFLAILLCHPTAPCLHWRSLAICLADCHRTQAVWFLRDSGNIISHKTSMNPCCFNKTSRYL